MALDLRKFGFLGQKKLLFLRIECTFVKNLRCFS